jgi:Protein of unknown function (DUF2800)
MKTLHLSLDPANIKVDLADERLGLPSASAANILAHCPGSWRMQMNRADIGRFKGDAARGTKLHAALNGEDVLLDADEFQDVQQMNDNCAELVAAWGAERPDLSPPEFASAEERLILRLGMVPVTTGQFDRLYMQGSRALLVDFKSGWQELGATASNMQLMVYALLLSEWNPDLEEIAVAIIRPRPGKPYWFTYGQESIESAAQLWGRILTEVFSEAPAIVSGTHCTFCRAQDICPARRQQLANFRVNADVIGARWELLAAEEKAELYINSRSVLELCEVIKDRVKEDMRRGELPGLHWKPGAVNKVITEPDAALSKMLSLGMTREDFLPAVSVSFAKLRDILTEKLNWKKKDADAIAKQIFDGCFIEKQNEASIKIS